MCGISLILESGGTAESTGTSLAAMHEALRHRGPDGEGFLRVSRELEAFRSVSRFPDFQWNDPATRVAAAFRHLRIQDPSPAAEQPLSSPDGLQWILMNGEIYNFEALRRELSDLGHPFATRSDTEVVLAAWNQWGPECFQRFNGMWALLIVDLERGLLAGSRDRLGIKPLFFMQERSRLVFASEPRALASAAEAGPQVHANAFRRFLHGFPPAHSEECFFENIRAVPAGSFFTLDLKAERVEEPKFERFWDLRRFVSGEAPPPDFETAAAELMALLEDAVRIRTSGQVQLGCLLSGGLDTSTVAALMAGAMKETRPAEEPRSYSIVYEDPSMSEAPYIWAVARKAKLLSRKLTLTADLCWESVDEVVRAQGQPLLGQDLVAIHHAYRIAREDGTIVILEGQGADELLGGMPSYASPVFRELLSGLRLFAFAAEVRAHARRYGRSPLGILRREVFGRLEVPESGPGSPSYPWLAGGGGPLPARETEESLDPSALNRHLFREVRVTNIPAVLLHQDRCSMAHGVESRAPFLDHRIVESCFRLPSSYKVRHGERKRVLLSGARRLLPESVLNRTDKKTPVSRIDWLPLREKRRDELREMATSRTIRECPWLEGSLVGPWVEAFIKREHDDVLSIWRLHTAWRWLESLASS